MNHRSPTGADSLTAGPSPFEFELTCKPIKHLYIRVDGDTARVKVSAPTRMSHSEISDAVIRNAAWIERRRSAVLATLRSTGAPLWAGGTVALFGVGHELRVEERTGRPACNVVWPGSVLMKVRPGSLLDERARMLDQLYRRELERHIPELIERWETRLGVRVSRCQVRKMKTRWGSCSPRSGRISLNLRLAAYPPQCLEYVVAHELTHLLVPNHGPTFYATLDRHLPAWKEAQALLRQAPRGARARGALDPDSSSSLISD